MGKHTNNAAGAPPLLGGLASLFLGSAAHSVDGHDRNGNPVHGSGRTEAEASASYQQQGGVSEDEEDD